MNSNLTLLSSLLFLALLLLTGCKKTELQKNFNDQELNTMITEFSELRLQYNLYSKENIPSNKEIMQLVFKNTQANETYAVKALQEKKPELVEKLFALKIPKN